MNAATGVAPAAVVGWHAIVDCPDPVERSRLLADLLADDVVFRSPAVHAPQQGRALSTMYLEAAMAVLGPSLTYAGETYAEDAAVLEFHADLDGILVHGVDMLRWDADCRLVGFTVMVRPVKGLEKLMERMAAQLFG